MYSIIMSGNCATPILSVIPCTNSPTKFQLRRDRLSRWTALGGTLILANGEPSVVTDTGQMKIGDGVTVWSGLP